MEPLLAEENKDYLLIKVNKSEFLGSFLDKTLKRIELERLVNAAHMDAGVVGYFKNDFVKHFNQSQERFYKG